MVIFDLDLWPWKLKLTAVYVDTVDVSLCSAALTVHMTSLECSTEDDALSADELESTIGDMDEPTDTETESISDGKNHSYTMQTPDEAHKVL